MAYSTLNPPVLAQQGSLDGTNARRFSYESTHTTTEIIAAGFITNGQDLGARLDDTVFANKSDSTTLALTEHRVTTVSSTGITLSSGTTIAGV